MDSTILLSLNAVPEQGETPDPVDVANARKI